MILPQTSYREDEDGDQINDTNSNDGNGFWGMQ